MDSASPEVDPLPSSPRMAYKFHFPYQPSTLLCSSLIFWTILCIICDIILPLLAVFLTFTIYGPTIYFAAQHIRPPPRATYEPTSRKTPVILSILWILIIPTHVYVNSKLVEPKAVDVFLIPILPASQAIIIMLYLSLRYTMEKRARRLSDVKPVLTEYALSYFLPFSSYSSCSNDF